MTVRFLLDDTVDRIRRSGTKDYEAVQDQIFERENTLELGFVA
jgi:hypothetical protein